MKTLLVLFFTAFYTLANAQDISVLFEELDVSVVTIQVTEYKIKNQQLAVANGIGSGVIISDKGHIITASHVVEFANEITVKLQNGTTYRADVLSSSSATDVALLKLRVIPHNLKAVTLGNSSTSKIGEQILIIGAPLGLEHSLSVGYISRKMKKNILANGDMAGFIQTDASINTGNSGGPMFNMKGELIGIVSFILSQGGGFEGLGFAADIDTARKTLLEAGSFWTGFDGLILNEGLANILNVPQQSGILIQHITPNSFADRIGLETGNVQAEILGQKLWLGGDIILSIQGLSCNNLHNFGDIRKQIENLRDTDQVMIKVLRKGEVVELTGLYQNNQ